MPEKQSRRLDSWKDIATYLGRDTRTAVRWEQEKALPVHRVPGGTRRAVFAYTDELDAWLNGGKAQEAATGRRLWWVWTAAIAAALIAALAGLLGYYLYRPGAPTRVTFAGRKMLAWDEKGRVSWEYEFPQAVIWPPAGLSRPVQVVDLDGDGRSEVFVAPAFADSANIKAARELDCFSSKGKLLWRYRPQLILNSPDRHYEGPWCVLDVMVVPHQGAARIWISLGHQEWWPSFLATLDAKGQATVRFINAGHLYALNRVETGAGSYLLAGGINNEYNAAMLAVLKEDQEPASSPQTSGSRYTCRECPSGRPVRYVLFPRSEVNLINGEPYNASRVVRVLEKEIQVVEEEDENGLMGVYQFSKNLELESAVWSSPYPDLHRRYEREGRIKHSFEACPERVGPRKIRVWDAEHGWRDVAVPQVIRPK